jgi:ATP-dependent Clp protease adaptor protein ClpS
MSVQPLILPTTTLLVEDEVEQDSPYNLFLWNDPVTPMMIVTRALKKIFGFSTEKAEGYMLIAHNEGKAVIFTGSHEKAESYCVQLHSVGLQATIAKDSK